MGSLGKELFGKELGEGNRLIRTGDSAASSMSDFSAGNRGIRDVFHGDNPVSHPTSLSDLGEHHPHVADPLGDKEAEEALKNMEPSTDSASATAPQTSDAPGY